ncbi:kumamolisin [Mycolicibacterium conceptionense]|uniref:Kumamolisin n=1 Tax=Mycolicibacterium conceptionense TaxID=451644 RepID=A0A0U1D0X8_9MYCO|nr:kumamolisin [Mycolicibacterium conceptionense]
MAGMNHAPTRALLALILFSALLVSDLRATPTTGDRAYGSAQISGPYAQLLSASTDLGPADNGSAQLTMTLHHAARPTALFDWAQQHALSVRWRPGNAWAITEGRSSDMATAFGVNIHDYRGRRGQEFYASPQQPSVPEPLTAEVSEVGRILATRRTGCHCPTCGTCPPMSRTKG